MARLEKQEYLDIQALTFAVETVCHLNPTRMDPRTVREYLNVCDRVRAKVLVEMKDEVAEVGDVPTN